MPAPLVALFLHGVGLAILLAGAPARLAVPLGGDAAAARAAAAALVVMAGVAEWLRPRVLRRPGSAWIVLLVHAVVAFATRACLPFAERALPQTHVALVAAAVFLPVAVTASWSVHALLALAAARGRRIFAPAALVALVLGLAAGAAVAPEAAAYVLGLGATFGASAVLATAAAGLLLVRDAQPAVGRAAPPGTVAVALALAGLMLHGLPASDRAHDAASAPPPHRLVALLSTLIDEPRRVLVVGAGAVEPDGFGAAAASTFGGTVVRVETARPALDRLDERFDLILVAPPRPPLSAYGRLLTRETVALLLDRLAPGGLLACTFDPEQVEARSASIHLFAALGATVDDFCAFVDDPAAARPLIAFASGPAQRTLDLERIGRRVTELGPRARGIADARSVVSCFLFDRRIVRIPAAGAMPNTDERPWLSLRLDAPAGAPLENAREIVAVLVRGRMMPRERLRGLPAGDAAEETMRELTRDFEATSRSFVAGAWRSLRLDGIDPRTHGIAGEVQDILLAAHALSPTFAPARNPLLGEIAARRAGGDFDGAAALLQHMAGAAVFAGFERDAATLRITLGDVRHAQGRIDEAAVAYRAALAALEPLGRADAPEARDAHLRLAFLLAAQGPEARADALPHLDAVLEATDSGAAIDDADLVFARAVRAWLRGDVGACRSWLDRAERPAGDGPDGAALFRYIRWQIDGPARD